MRIIGKGEFDDAPEKDVVPLSQVVSDASLDAILLKLEQPVELQREVVAQVYLSLQERMRRDMAEQGVLSESTRRWVELWNGMADSLHRNLFGDKSVSLHLHKISHSQIAAHIRKNAGLVVDVTEGPNDFDKPSV